MPVSSRQFIQALPGAMLGNDQENDIWEVADAFIGSGTCSYATVQMDLRGLTAGKEVGLDIESLSLQEAGPWTAPDLTDTGFMVTDVLTTVRPTEAVIAAMYERPDTATGRQLGFLYPVDTLISDVPSNLQSLNPSQILWGVWRLYGQDAAWRAGQTMFRVAQSGYFGQGDVAVSPALFWTRVVITNKLADLIICPSANLLSYGRGVSMTAPEEMTQMMRAAQR